MVREWGNSSDVIIVRKKKKREWMIYYSNSVVMINVKRLVRVKKRYKFIFG